MHDDDEVDTDMRVGVQGDGGRRGLNQGEAERGSSRGPERVKAGILRGSDRGGKEGRGERGGVRSRADIPLGKGRRC